ncbi:MAG: c-type cytochrome biogenesis protein CcmI, partial [Pseudomonadota bacterium]
MIWALGAALLIVTVGGLLWPVVRGRKDTLKRTESALAIFEDQLAEVDRDADRGLISGQEAESARTEIKRRMIAAAKVKDSQTQSGGTWLVLLSVLLVPFGTFGVYMATGSPQVPSLPFAEREVERSQTAELQQLAQDLRDRLLSAPDGGPSEGWVLLGQTYMRLGLYTDAAVA